MRANIFYYKQNTRSFVVTFALCGSVVAAIDVFEQRAFVYVYARRRTAYEKIRAMFLPISPAKKPESHRPRFVRNIHRAM